MLLIYDNHATRIHTTVTEWNGLVNSRNENSGISVEWISSNTWGAGTGTDNTNAKLLNGLIEGGDNKDAPSTIIFSNVPDGSYSMLIYAVARPLELPTADFEQLESEQSIFMTMENADTYNESPEFRQVTSTDIAARGTGNYVRFDDIAPDNDGNVTLNFWDEGIEAANSTVNALQLIETAKKVLRFTSIQLDPSTRNATLTWASGKNRSYIMERSTDLLDWEELTDSIASEGDSTSYVDVAVPADLAKAYYRVTEE